jgi:hypothetical protein
MWPIVRRLTAMLLIGIGFFGALATSPSAQQPLPNASVSACPVMTPELTALAKTHVGRGQCRSGCKGCGCKGGPGFRERGSRKCVGWVDVIAKCGPPPHPNCVRECVPAKPECENNGLAWFRSLVASAGLTLSVLPSELKDGEEPGPDAAPNLPTSDPN